MNKAGRTNGKGEIRIDELFDEIHETETMNMGDGSELLQDRLTEEERARIKGRIMGQIQQETFRPQYRKRKRILLASLIAVCAFASTAFAAELFHWDTRISNYLGIHDENQGDLNGAGMNVGVSAENGGVIIEAVQTIGDSSNMHILFNVTVPEGQIVHPQTGFEMIYLMVKGATGLGYSCDLLPDEDPNDNKGTLLLSLEANSEINDKDIELRFVNMRHYDMEVGDMVEDYKGEWVLKWKLDYQDISRNFDIKKDIEINGRTVRVDSISISPIALKVIIRGDYIEEYDSVPPNPEDGDLFEITSIKLRNGTELTLEDAMGWGTSVSGKEYVINLKMQKLLEPQEIIGIVVNDTEIKL